MQQTCDRQTTELKVLTESLSASEAATTTAAAAKALGLIASVLGGNCL